MTIPTQMATSDFNLEKISTQQLSAHLDYSIAAGSNVIIIGRRGSGKTYITRECIEASKCRELYVNLSVFERPDLAGFPRLTSDLKQKFIDYLMPRMYEPLMTGDQKVVVLFDEVDKCDSSIWAALLEIVQSHSINGHVFPNLQSCIMTGNLIAEGGNKICAPLADRAEAYLLQADTAQWLTWAGISGEIHSSIFEYIQDHPLMLFGADDLGENVKDASPRGWHLSSNIIKFAEQHNYPIETMLEKIGGFVGKKASIDFSTYYTHYQVLLPFVESVFAGENVAAPYHDMSPGDKISACMIIASRFATQLDACDPLKDKPACVDTIGQFMHKTAGHENVLSSMRSADPKALRLKKWNLIKHPTWSKLFKDINISSDGLA